MSFTFDGASSFHRHRHHVQWALSIRTSKMHKIYNYYCSRLFVAFVCACCVSEQRTKWRFFLICGFFFLSLLLPTQRQQQKRPVWHILRSTQSASCRYSFWSCDLRLFVCAQQTFCNSLKNWKILQITSADNMRCCVHGNPENIVQTKIRKNPPQIAGNEKKFLEFLSITHFPCV